MAMSKKVQENYAKCMERIENEIFNHQGSGFTIEFRPEVVTALRYEGYPTFFGDKEYKWHLPLFPDTDHVTIENLLRSNEWRLSLGHDVERYLPKEILVKRSFPTIVVDQRKNKNPTGTWDNAYVISGRRVYVTVPDDYAAKVFREVYVDIGLPFRDMLLAKHSKTLQEIFCFVNDCVANNFSVTISTDGCFTAEVTSTRALAFEKLGMLPLNSIGQVYGMTLAIVEQLKEEQPSISTRITRVGSESINVKILRMEKPEEPKELKSW